MKGGTEGINKEGDIKGIGRVRRSDLLNERT